MSDRRPGFALYAGVAIGVGLLLMPLLGLVSRSPWSSTAELLASVPVQRALLLSLVVLIAGCAAQTPEPSQPATTAARFSAAPQAASPTPTAASTTAAQPRTLRRPAEPEYDEPAQAATEEVVSEAPEELLEGAL